MQRLYCPWCGLRDHSEFHYGGEAHRQRPSNPEALSDAEWADFLFMRSNSKGAFRERWMHALGCRRWFNVERHTVTHAVTRTYPMETTVPTQVDAPLNTRISVGRS
jgi:heterotetrameric sarcosine oxidase delta subunit